MNNKYKNGKIYCIWSYETSDIYIGSSCEELDYRMKKHKDAYKQFLNGKKNYISSFEIIKYGDAEIGIIEEFPCQSRKELERREGQLQRVIKCVNLLIAGRTNKEWREENKESIAKKDKLKYEKNKEHIAKRHKNYNKKNKEPIARMKKIYYEKNKEEIAEKKKKIFECECGSNLRAVDKVRHFKTIKHQKYLEQQQ